MGILDGALGAIGRKITGNKTIKLNHEEFIAKTKECFIVGADSEALKKFVKKIKPSFFTKKYLSKDGNCKFIFSNTISIYVKSEKTYYKLRGLRSAYKKFINETIAIIENLK